MSHEAPLFLFRERPELAAELLREVLGVEVPAHTRAQVEDADFTQIVPTSYRADLVITLRGDGPVMGIVVETQLSPDPDKRFTWPLYLAALHAKVKCRTCLIVIVPTDEMARWASAPIVTLQPGSSLVPIVLGPSRVPIVTSLEEAEHSPERAVLSALAHSKGEHRFEVAWAALGAAARLIDDERRTLYTDLILEALGADGRAALELNMDLTNYEFRSEYFKSKIEDARSQAAAEGRAEGEAHAVLMVLEARGIAVSAEIRARVVACVDRITLERWIVRAATATTADEVVAER